MKTEHSEEEENEYEKQRKENMKRNKEKMKQILGETTKTTKKKTTQKKRSSRRLAGELLTDESEQTEDEGSRNVTVTFQRRERQIGKGTPRGPNTAGPNVMRKVSGKIYDSTNGQTCHQVS